LPEDLHTPPPADDPAERRLLARLRAGDEAAFMEIVDAWGPSMLRLARQFTPSTAVAEEVVQETWVAVLSGLDRFEGRSSLKTWVLRILVNRAKTRGARERRTVPFAALASEESAGGFEAVAADRFLSADHARWPHHWGAPLPRWEAQPEGAAQSAETLALIHAAIEVLPPAQRTVILLRDVEGWDGPQVSNALDITETNQRVLLHRARSKVRAALAEHLAPPS
jgi:RNA polymerase sigma-70 factor (ECF subfamily)